MRLLLFLGRVLIAFLSVAIGMLAVSTFRYLNAFANLELGPIVREAVPFQISACDLGEPTGKFVGKRISIEATVYHVSWSNARESEDFIIVYPLLPVGCRDAGFDPFITTELDLRRYVGPNANLKFELGPFEREVDVRIVGTVRKVGRSASSIEYKIEPETIELISPWRDFTPKGAA